MNPTVQTRPTLKSDEERLVEIEGSEVAEQYMATLDQLIFAKSLSDACKVKGCLSERTFHRVKTRSREAWQLYTRARATRADHRFDNLSARLEKIKDPQKARVILEAEKWTIGKMNRGLYGDDPVTIQGVNGGPIQMQHTHTNTALDEIRKRLDRKRKAIEGGVLQAIEEGGAVEGVPSPHTLTDPPNSAAHAPEISQNSAEIPDVTRAGEN